MISSTTFVDMDNVDAFFVDAEGGVADVKEAARLDHDYGRYGRNMQI